MDYDCTAMPEVYDAGRSYSPRTLERWLEAIAASIPDRRIRRILDLGCGTGRYSAALAERFGADVHAIDPSERMLAQARKKRHVRVRYERAAGEKLPLADGYVDLVFMSMVLHHFDDCPRVLRECRRVLRNGGSICLRAGTLEQVATYPQCQFFPEASPILDGLLQSCDSVLETFAEAGFRCAHHELVESEAATSWDRFAERVAFRADSVLSQLSDEAFATGMERLRSYARARPSDEPVIELVDLFVFQAE